jgi:hypothetical protein
LYQGTTLVVPNKAEKKKRALAPEGITAREQAVAGLALTVA